MFPLSHKEVKRPTPGNLESASLYSCSYIDLSSQTLAFKRIKKGNQNEGWRLIRMVEIADKL